MTSSLLCTMSSRTWMTFAGYLWSVLPVPVLIGDLEFGRLSVAGDDESIAMVK